MASARLRAFPGARPTRCARLAEVTNGMPQFIYEAVTAGGKKTKGVLRAASKTAAIQELRGKGLLIRSVQEKKSGLMDREIAFGRPVKPEHFVLFCRQFAVLIRSGIQIDQALEIMEDQTASGNLKAALADVTEKVRNGASFSRALGEHPKIFPELFVNTVMAGEAGGNLDEVLTRIADHYEKEHKTIQKVKSAMTYPVIVLLLAVAVVIFLLLRIVPTFTRMFEEQGAELPLATRVIMAASGLAVNGWWMLLLGAAAAGLGLKLAFGTERGKLAFDRLKFRMPVFGIVFRKAAIARMCRTLVSLYGSGVPVLQAMDMTARVVGNRVLARALAESRAGLAEGKQMSEPLEASGLFPKLVISMLRIGEETGQIDQMLRKAAEFYENDVEQTVDRLKAVLEPFMLLIVAGIVGFIVIAVMSPMFAIYESYLK